MIWKAVCLFLGISLGSPAALSTGGEGGNPCGVQGIQTVDFTAYMQNKFNAEYRDLPPEKVELILKKIDKEDSGIVSVRVFRAPQQTSYAVVFSYLFENYLNDRPLVQVHCVERINDAVALFLTHEELLELLE